MKKITALSISGIIAFSAIVGCHLHADSQQTCRIIGVVGSSQVVRLSRSVIVSGIDITKINTAGTDISLLGSLDLALFSTTGASYVDISSPDADSGSLFRMLKTTSPDKQIYLYVTSDSLASGQLAPKPTELKNGAKLRVLTTDIANNEVQNIAVYAKDNAANASDSGTYETLLIFAWHAST